MSVVYLAFANSREHPLPTLSEEEQEITKKLSPLELKKHFILVVRPYMTPDKIAEDLVQYRNDLSFFLYSGHAEKDSLLLDDQSAHAGGIAQFLGQCPALQLVFLNGCSTGGQVEGLLKQGVPAILATSAKVEDQKATNFSIRFFQALADHGSVQDAFQVAKADVQMRDKTIQPTISHVLPVWGEDPPEFLWGLFTQPDKKSVLEWKLPFTTQIESDDKFEPNALLIRTLLETLAPFNAEVKAIVEKESSDDDDSDFDDFGDFEEVEPEDAISNKIAAIKQALPHPISLQINKLLVEPAPGSLQTTYYHKLGIDRLKQIHVIYSTFVELLVFTMLTQIWELAQDQKEIKVNDDQRNIIKQFLSARVSNSAEVKLAAILRTVRGILDQNAIPYFVEEFEEVIESMNARTSLTSSIHFMESLSGKLSGHIEDLEARQLCVVGEEHLAQFISHVSFLANYALVSIKAIDVVNYPHLPKPKFIHKIIKLETKKERLEETLLVGKKFLDCNSVLLRKGSGKSTAFLNLSPFVIDQNAFDEKANIAKLYFFDNYEKDSDTIAFKHVYKPSDVRLRVKDQENLNIIKEQFEAFTTILFQKPLKAL